MMRPRIRSSTLYKNVKKLVLKVDILYNMESLMERKKSNMRPFSLLIKPAGADCNLRCEYCFYLGRSELYPEQKVHRMDEATLTRLVRGYLALPFPIHSFAFQGGEPLLMGEDFYRTLVRLQRRYARPGAIIQNFVQTNATLFTPSLARFFAEEGFLVGVSVDGPEAVHNLRRCDAAGNVSHAAVMRGIDCLREAGTEFNILTLITQANVHQPLETYRYLRDIVGTRYMQFIECVEWDEKGQLLPYAIQPEEWANFICTLFDEWIEKDVASVSVRLFDSIASKMQTGNPNSCAMGNDCRAYFVVEHNGDVYPCGFFVRPELKLGNLHEHDWDELWDAPLHTQFGQRKACFNTLCETCAWRTFCNGDCPKNRTGHDASRDARTLSHLCPAWKRIYGHLVPALKALLQQRLTVPTL